MSRYPSYLVLGTLERSLAMGSNTMSSSCARTRAARVVSELKRLLDETRLAAVIDEPIDRVAEALRHECAEANVVAGLHEVAARFVQRLHAEALPGKRELSAAQALDEAIALLERGYAGRAANSYFEAVLDATDESHAGIELVLARMADAVKAQRRALYVRWLIARHVDPADWELRCSLASLLLERCKLFLPPQLQACSPEQLADLAIDLLLSDLATANQLRQACVDL